MGSLRLIPKLLTALCLNDEGVLFRAHEGEGGKWKHVSLKTCHICQTVKAGIEEHDDSFYSLPSVCWLCFAGYQRQDMIFFNSIHG